MKGESSAAWNAAKRRGSSPLLFRIDPVSSAGSSESKSAADCPPTFEQALADLEAIVHRLEEGDIGLADALQQYEQGIKHLRRCYELLEHAERKIELLTGIDAQGNPITEPFDAERSPPEEAGRRRARTTRRSPASSAPPSRDVDDPDAVF